MSRGPGNLPLINGLFDCHRPRVPVLTIAAVQCEVIVAQDTQVDIVSGAMFRGASSAYFPTLCLREFGG